MHLLVGVLSSLLGLGGGELMGPLLLAIGMLPRTTSATTATTSMLSTLSNEVHYAIEGVLTPEYSALVFCLGLVGGLVGRRSALYISAHFGRPSVIVFALGLVLTCSLSLMVYDLLSSEADWSFHRGC